MFTTSSDDGHEQLLLEFADCRNAEHFAFNDAPCGELLVMELTVRTSSASRFSAVRFSDGAGWGCVLSTFLRCAGHLFLYSSWLAWPADFQAFAAILVAGSSGCARVAQQIISVGDLV